MCDLLVCQDLILNCDQPSRVVLFLIIEILTPLSIDAFHIDDKFDVPLILVHTLFIAN